jgi:hypothetical protein
VFLLIGPWLARRVGSSESMALAGAGVLRLECRCVHDIARAARLHPALARADLRSVPPGGDPTYRGRGAGPPGGDSAGDLRHRMRWLSDRVADIRVGPALCAVWRRGISAHGRALLGGPAHLRRLRAPVRLWRVEGRYRASRTSAIIAVDVADWTHTAAYSRASVTLAEDAPSSHLHRASPAGCSASIRLRAGVLIIAEQAAPPHRDRSRLGFLARRYGFVRRSG